METPSILDFSGSVCSLSSRPFKRTLFTSVILVHQVRNFLVQSQKTQLGFHFSPEFTHSLVHSITHKRFCAHLNCRISPGLSLLVHSLFLFLFAPLYYRLPFAMAGTQQLPSWMTLSTAVITNANGQPIATSVTTLELPLTYYGPSVSVPLSIYPLHLCAFPPARSSPPRAGTVSPEPHLPWNGTWMIGKCNDVVVAVTDISSL